MYEHVFATALRLNEAVSFCWIEPFNGTSSHSMLHSCPGQTAGRSNLSLRVGSRRLALGGHFLRARTQSRLVARSELANVQADQIFPGRRRNENRRRLPLWLYCL